MTDPEHEAAASTAVMRLRAEPAAGVKPYRAGNLDAVPLLTAARRLGRLNRADRVAAPSRR